MTRPFTYERVFSNWLCINGHHAERTAASGAARLSVCDIVGIIDQVTYLIEIKRCKSNKLRLQPREIKQLNRLLDVCEKHKLKALLVIKWKLRGYTLIHLKKPFPLVYSLDDLPYLYQTSYRGKIKINKLKNG